MLLLVSWIVREPKHVTLQLFRRCLGANKICARVIIWEVHMEKRGYIDIVAVFEMDKY